LGLIDNLFDKDAPLRPADIAGYRLLPYIGYLIVVTFCILILLAPQIWLYCTAALVLHANDIMGQAIVFQNLNKVLVKFPIVDQSSKSKFVNERREVIKEYYYDHPTFPRIAGINIITVITLIISIEIAPARPVFYLVAYALMISNILVGELMIGSWRAKRDWQLDDITRREAEELQARKA
jgi:hypothetical protein